MWQAKNMFTSDEPPTIIRSILRRTDKKKLADRIRSVNCLPVCSSKASSVSTAYLMRFNNSSCNTAKCRNRTFCLFPVRSRQSTLYTFLCSIDCTYNFVFVCHLNILNNQHLHLYIHSRSGLRLDNSVFNTHLFHNSAAHRLQFI